MPVQQLHHPALDIVPVGLLPAGLAGLAEQVAGGEPADGAGVALDRPGRFALGGQVQLERADVRRERACVQLPRLPGRRRSAVIVLLSSAGPAVICWFAGPRFSGCGIADESGSWVTKPFPSCVSRSSGEEPAVLARVVGAENLRDQAIFVNHAPGAIAPLDPELIQIRDAVGQLP